MGGSGRAQVVGDAEVMPGDSCMGKLVEVLVRGKITRYSFFPPKNARCGKREVTGFEGRSGDCCRWGRADRKTRVLAIHYVRASWGAAVLRPYMAWALRAAIGGAD